MARLAAAAMAVAMLAIGIGSWWRERRLGGGAEGFWTAHRSLSGWSLGMSLSASMLSVSWSLVYGVELLYRWGPGGLWLLAVPWLAVLVLFALLAPRLRRFPAFSQGELFGALFGPAMRWLTVAVLVAVFSAWCGAEIAAAGELIAPLLETTPRVAMTAIAVLVAAYSWAGGFRSVVATDVAQFFIVVAFLGIVAARALPQAAPHAGSWFAIPGPTVAVVAITLLAYVTGWLAEADIWLRLTAARDDRHARIAIAVTAAASLLFVVALPAVLAAAARRFFPDPAALAQPVLGALLERLMPPGLRLLLLGGLAAVALSTVSTTANVVALTAARDSGGSGRAGLAASRWASAAAVFLALAHRVRLALPRGAVLPLRGAARGRPVLAHARPALGRPARSGGARRRDGGPAGSRARVRRRAQRAARRPLPNRRRSRWGSATSCRGSSPAASPSWPCWRDAAAPPDGQRSGSKMPAARFLATSSQAKQRPFIAT